MDFQIEHKALYEMIADKLELFILHDTSRVSQKLPSEQYLADSFGVSRPVIREALKLLKERGLIASRQGSASVITEYDTDSFVKAMSRMAYMKNVTPEQIYPIRSALEILSAKLAAANATEESIASLRAINERMHAPSLTHEERICFDVDFHKAVAEMSQNPLLSCMIETLSSFLFELFEKSVDESTDTHGIALHDQLVEAIAARDEDAAADIMRTHLMISVRNYEIRNNSPKQEEKK